MIRADVTPLWPDDRLDRAMELFAESELLALPVVDGDARRVVGIVKRTDVLTTYLRYVQGVALAPQNGPALTPENVNSF